MKQKYKLYLIKIKNVYTSNTIKKAKWSLEWEKIFASPISDNGLVLRIDKKLLQLLLILFKNSQKKMYREPTST